MKEIKVTGGDVVTDLFYKMWCEVRSRNSKVTSITAKHNDIRIILIREHEPWLDEEIRELRMPAGEVE